jgi:hypothetical protein
MHPGALEVRLQNRQDQVEYPQALRKRSNSNAGAIGAQNNLEKR